MGTTAGVGDVLLERRLGWLWAVQVDSERVCIYFDRRIQ